MQRRPSGGDLSEQIRLVGARRARLDDDAQREEARGSAARPPCARRRRLGRAGRRAASDARRRGASPRGATVASRERPEVERCWASTATPSTRCAPPWATRPTRRRTTICGCSASCSAPRATRSARRMRRSRRSATARTMRRRSRSPPPGRRTRSPTRSAACSRQDVQRGVSRRGEPLLVVRGGHCKVRELMRAHSAREVADYINFCKEAAFLACDRETRRTGRLVKMITVIDMKDFRWSDFDQRFLNALGKAEKVGELCYPQLLGLAVVVNAPAIMSMSWGWRRARPPGGDAREGAVLRVARHRGRDGGALPGTPRTRGRPTPSPTSSAAAPRRRGCCGSTPTPRSARDRAAASRITVLYDGHGIAHTHNASKSLFFSPSSPCRPAVARL